MQPNARVSPVLHSPRASGPLRPGSPNPPPCGRGPTGVGQGGGRGRATTTCCHSTQIVVPMHVPYACWRRTHVARATWIWRRSFSISACRRVRPKAACVATRLTSHGHTSGVALFGEWGTRGAAGSELLWRDVSPSFTHSPAACRRQSGASSYASDCSLAGRRAEGRRCCAAACGIFRPPLFAIDASRPWLASPRTRSRRRANPHLLLSSVSCQGPC